ncbi:MAG: hypothetical protein ACPGYX_10230, partial [Oceanobacter sp.]
LSVLQICQEVTRAFQAQIKVPHPNQLALTKTHLLSHLKGDKASHIEEILLSAIVSETRSIKKTVDLAFTHVKYAS